VAQYNGEPAARVSIATREQLKKRRPPCHCERRRRTRPSDERLRSDPCHAAATESLHKPRLDKPWLDKPRLGQYQIAARAAEYNPGGIRRR
jgi:hypothetical protein